MMVLRFTIMASTVTIDDAGRLVIPQAIRQRLHLQAGSRLLLTERDSQIILEAEPSEARLIEVSGVLVVAGELEGTIPDHRDLRSERLDHLASMAPPKRR